MSEELAKKNASVEKKVFFILFLPGNGGYLLQTSV